MNEIRDSRFKVRVYILIALAVICLLTFFPFKAYAATVTDPPDYAVDDDWSAYTTGQSATYLSKSDYVFETNAFATIEDAVARAVLDGGTKTIGIAAGSYTLASTLTVSGDITLEGADASTVTITPDVSWTTDTTLISFEDTGSLTGVGIMNVTIDGTGYDLNTAIYSDVPLTVTDITIQNITHSTADSETGIYTVDSVVATGVTMSNIGQNGILVTETGTDEVTATINGFTYTGKNNASELDYGVIVGDGVVCNIGSTTTITDCIGTTTFTSAAVTAYTTSGTDSTALTIDSSVLTNNAIGVAVGMVADDTTTVTVNNTTLTPSTGGLNVDSFSTQILDFTNNKWGTNVYSEVTASINAVATVSVLPYVMSNDVTSDHYLGALSVSSGALTPTFDSLTLSYSVPDVGFEVDSITITPTLIHTSTSTIEVAGSPVNSGEAGTVALAEGDNAINVVVTAGVDTTTYVVNVYRQHDYQLSALAVLDSNDGTTPWAMYPAFDKDTYAYNAFVDAAASSIDITATASDAVGASITAGTGTGLTWTSLPEAFTVTVQSSDGVDQDYVITVARESTDGTLTDIQLNGTSLTEFSAGTFTYSQSVAYSVDTAVFAVTPNDSYATYTINGSAPVASYALAVGDNIFTFVTTAQDGSGTETYTVTITRQAETFNNADLSALTVDGVSVPSFDAATTAYSVEVGASTSTVTIAATAEDPLATVSGTGANLLNETGSTLIGVEVTAQDGTTTKTYTITVTKAAAADATLSDLTVEGTTVTGFASGTHTYTMDVASTVASVTIGATATDGAATVTGTGSTALDYGSNIVTVTVEGSDGVDTNYYTITITRAGETDATLSDLTLDGTTLTDFSSAVTNYTVYADEADTSVDVAATATISGATITGTGTIAISEGTNNISVVVTAADGTTTKTYTISVVHPGSNSAEVSTITIDGTEISGFSHSTYEYVIEKPAGTTSVVVAATTLDTGATLTGTGIVTLATGGNDVEIVVTSEDGSATQTYTLTIFNGFKADATLSDIKVAGTTVSGFNPATTSYTVNVANTVTGAWLTAATTDEYASVSGVGYKAFNVGNNTFTLTATADDDSTTKAYTVLIVRAAATTSGSSSSSDDDDDDDDSSSSSSSSDDDDDDDDSTSSSSSSSSSSGDDSEDEDDADDDDSVNPLTSKKEVVEDVLLKDTEKTQDGDTIQLTIDEDAFFAAILNALSLENVEEGDGASGINALPYVSFPKVNSVGEMQSVAVGFSSDAIAEAFKQGVGIIATLDNFQVKLPANAFDAEGLKDTAIRYLLSKALLDDTVMEDIKEQVPSGKEIFFGVNIGLLYDKVDGTGDSASLDSTDLGITTVEALSDSSAKTSHFDFDGKTVSSLNYKASSSIYSTLAHNNTSGGFIQIADADGISTVEINTLDESAEIMIALDNETSKIFSEAGSVNDISLYVYDENYGQILSLNYVYDAKAKTLTFKTKRLGKFVLTKKVVEETNEVVAPIETETKNEKKSFPTFIVVVCVAAAILLGAIIYLLIRRFKDGDQDGDDGNNLTI